MLTTAIFLTVLSHVAGGSSPKTCVPKSSIISNDRICVCSDEGTWSDKQCDIDICQPGELIYRGCNRCICGADYQLVCTNDVCLEEHEIGQKELMIMGHKCIPKLKYFIECTICTCPESGSSAQAACSSDHACASRLATTPEFILSRNICLPKVMYLFPCLHCLCTESGTFSSSNCYETCLIKETSCKPKSFYKNGCNVCYCPEDGVKDNKICSSKDCNQKPKMQALRQDRLTKCSAHGFTEPKCLYCDCSALGKVNENACLELECIDTNGLEFNADKDTCRPGEMVLICSECLCLENGTTSAEYCSKVCTYESKMKVLNKAVKDSIVADNLIDKAKLKRTSGNSCRPETVVLHQGRYCLCPNSGTIVLGLCSSMHSDDQSFLNQIQNNIERPDKIKIEFGTPCKQGTFVEFDCNSCFCSDGIIDPNWCTYDDCTVKSNILKPKKHQLFGFGIQASAPPKAPPTKPGDGSCTPGSISKTDCNFCICPDTGILKQRVCTKNNCTKTHETINQDFSCQPMQYYEVDCNVCLCPRDGQKNVDKCTKNVCQKSFLRSSGDCSAGELFSDECNVCVCPLNGNKDDKACTDHECPESEANLMFFNQTQIQTALEERKLDFCFSGEQFIEDCKFCVCPDTGLRAHATCNSMLCDDEQRRLMHKGLGSRTHELPFIGQSANQVEDQCNVFEVQEIIDETKCEAGAVYTDGCKQCICPMLDGGEKFCRGIPSIYCVNYSPGEVQTTHIHKTYPCTKTGKLMDACFVCDCEEQGDKLIVVGEHCFKSESVGCRSAQPDFLKNAQLL